MITRNINLVLKKITFEYNSEQEKMVYKIKIRRVIG